LSNENPFIRLPAKAPDIERTPWPIISNAMETEDPRVGIVLANFNTRCLTAQLVFSLCRVLGRSEFVEIVVVDNASTDGSPELLEALHDASLIHLIRNRSQRYHGPALTQGISWLARRQHTVAAHQRVDYVWVLDSDVIVLRRETVRDALRLFKRSGAAAVGQKTGDPTYDRLLRHNPEMLHPCSLMLDPAHIWRQPIPPFIEDGAPSTALQVAADEQGLRLVQFPFIEDGYLPHLGRGTLREVAGRNDTNNRYYEWAVDHRDYHFAGRAEGAKRLAAFASVFDTEVGELTPAGLVAACLQSTILSLG
jgi:glycosyltransferase involved in cell wall biosynthesis